MEHEASRPRILIVEDDIFVQGLLSAVLESEGFSCCRAGSAQEALEEVDSRSFSAILLDLGLPDEEGLSLLRKLRSRTPAPVIVVTAHEGLDERLTALELGAEDFVVKPMEPKELVLRLRRLVRPVSVSEDTPIEVSGWRLYPARRVLKNPAGREISLRRAEFNLLAAFFRAPGRIFSRDQLLDAITKGPEAPTDRTVDVLVSRIRTQLGQDGPRLIRTIRGVGYGLRVSGE